MITHTVRCANGNLKTFEGYGTSLAIRAFCTECMGWETDPRECTSDQCPLFPFRGKTGKTRTAKVVEMSPERRAEASERMKAMRDRRQNPQP